MNKTLKIILIVLGILILLGVSFFLWQYLNKGSIQYLGYEEHQRMEEFAEQAQFNSEDYCEVEIINGTPYCLPEGVCEFKEDGEGSMECIAKRV